MKIIENGKVLNEINISTEIFKDIQGIIKNTMQNYEQFEDTFYILDNAQDLSEFKNLNVVTDFECVDTEYNLLNYVSKVYLVNNEAAIVVYVNNSILKLYEEQ